MGGQLPVLHGLNQSLTNFVLGLRTSLVDSLGLALTSYTDTRLARLHGNQPAGVLTPSTPYSPLPHRTHADRHPISSTYNILRPPPALHQLLTPQPTHAHVP